RTLKAETVNEFQSLLTSAATRYGGLPRTGAVSLDGQTARFTRPGLVEEYHVSMDGVRQDFVVLERPRSFAQERGELALWLGVSGARVEPAAGGARLVLENSGRKIADRKSTRLNSSHVAISYAVFCLKKKKYI